jgi:hypothetical protein
MIMRSRLSIIALCLTAIAVCVVPSVYAGDVLSRLTDGHQYSLALGSIVSTSDTTVRFEAKTIISGKTLPSVISVEIPDECMGMEAPNLAPGNYAVLSLNKEAAPYTIAWGIFKVSSLDMATLGIIEGTLPLPDQMAFQWYLNSEGTERDFYFVGTDAYVRHSDGTSTRLYPSPAASEGSINDEQTTGEVIKPSPSEESGAAEWQYAIIAVILLLASSVTLWAIRVKQSAC